MTYLVIFAAIALLVLLISWGKVHAFIAFLLVSLLAGVCLGMPLANVPKSAYKGIGDTLGSIIGVVIFGAMLGKLVAISGAAQRIALVILSAFGQRYVIAALVITGFVVGIPLFYNVGFVLMIPLIFSVAARCKLPLVYLAVPMMASLSVMHGFLPPHPSPTILVAQFGANLGLTFVYGMAIAVPTIILAGPVFALTVKKVHSEPMKAFYTDDMPEEQLPGVFNSFFSSLLPVILIAALMALQYAFPQAETLMQVLALLSDPTVLMLVSLLVATYTLGVSNGKRFSSLMDSYTGAVKEVALILLIIGGAGALKQVMIDSGANALIADSLGKADIHPLVLGWSIAALVRVCLGSATVAGLTTAGIMLPILTATGADPNLMVLAIGAGSLMFSHVNDSGFWMFKEYFNLSIGDTIRTWSLMETIVAIAGLGGVMALNAVIN